MSYKRKSPTPINEGGSNTIGANYISSTVLFYSPTSGPGSTPAFSSIPNGSTGQVLAANVSGNPTFQSVSSLGSVISIAGDTGTATPSAGVINLLNGGQNITTAATGSTITVNVSGNTNHSVLLGNSSGGINSLTVPSANTILQGNAAADPSFTASPSIGGTVTIGTGLTITPFTYGALVSSNAGVISSAAGTTGTVMIGTTGSSPSFSATPAVTSITISNSPSVSTDGANKAYVDAVATGLAYQGSVVAATTANLNAAYLNGAAGVGATLTNLGALAAFTIDGVTPTINQRVLVKNQSSTFQNGIYTVSTLGTGVIAWILTRATDYDTAVEIRAGSVVPVDVGGTVNGGTSWIQTQTVVTVGTDPIIFVQFSFAAGQFLQGIHEPHEG